MIGNPEPQFLVLIYQLNRQVAKDKIFNFIFLTHNVMICKWETVYSLVLLASVVPTSCPVNCSS